MSDTVKNPISRKNAIAWAVEIVGNPQVVYIDTETTGLGPDAEIVDIGIVGPTGLVILDSLVKPTRPIPPEAGAVHGISDEMVADAYTWPQMYPIVADHLLGKTVVIYNAGYDTQILKQVTEAAGLPPLPMSRKAECAMLAYSDFDGTPGKYPGQRKWHKLDVAAAFFGIPPGGHRALADAETCRRVVLGMAHRYVRPADPEPPQPAQGSLFDTANPDRFTR